MDKHKGQDLENRLDELNKQRQRDQQNLNDKFNKQNQDLSQKHQRQQQDLNNQQRQQQDQLSQQQQQQSKQQGDYDKNSMSGQQKPLDRDDSMDYTNNMQPHQRPSSDDSISKQEAEDLLDAYGRENRNLPRKKDKSTASHEKSYKDW